MITFPSTIIPAQAEWGLLSNTKTFSSPLTGATQTLRLPGERWTFSFTYSALTAEQRALITSFLVKARGGAERFKMSNPMGLAPRGAGGGTPVVAGAGQTGSSLATSGWPNSTVVLKEGDYFECNGELKMAAADVTSDGAGTATITFEPPLRASPANGASIITTNPAATFRLSENETKWQHLQGAVSSLVITGIESWI